MSLFKPAPLNTDSEAVEEFEKCDYSIKITEEMALEGTAPRKVRVLADGIYDLLHYGHLRQIMQAKNAFPKSTVYLIVGVPDEQTTLRIKGKTVQSYVERVETLRHCRYVDEVYLDVAYFATLDTVAEMKVDFIAHDALPYMASQASDCHYQIFRDLGMFVTTDRTKGVSTTAIISSIVRDYDQYLRRNLQRGCTREELNIGFLQEKQITVGNAFSNLFDYWLHMSGSLLTRFLMLFQSKNSIELNEMNCDENTSPDPAKLRQQVIKLKNEEENNPGEIMKTHEKKI